MRHSQALIMECGTRFTARRYTTSTVYAVVVCLLECPSVHPTMVAAKNEHISLITNSF